MNSLMIFLILKLGVIGSLLFWYGFLYLCHLVVAYCRVWWDTPSMDECWAPYWQGKKRKLIGATAIMLVSLLLPSTREAAVMYVVPAIAESSIWNRIFGSGNNDMEEQVRRWVRETTGH